MSEAIYFKIPVVAGWRSAQDICKVIRSYHIPTAILTSDDCVEVAALDPAHTSLLRSLICKRYPAGITEVMR